MRYRLLSIVHLTGVLILLSGCGPTYQEFRSEENNYSVLVPDDAAETCGDDPDSTTCVMLAHDGPIWYHVVVLTDIQEFDITNAMDRSELMGATLDCAPGAGNDPVDYNGYPGIRFHGYCSGVPARGVVYQIETRLYIIYALVDGDISRYEDRIDEFLNSFDY